MVLTVTEPDASSYKGIGPVSSNKVQYRQDLELA